MAGVTLSKEVLKRLSETRQRVVEASKGAATLKEAYSRFNQEQYSWFYEGGEPKHKAWKDFYRWHSDRVSAAASKAEKEKACIMGAGACADIPLEELASYFSKVYLLDMDRKAPLVARSRLPKELRWKVDVVSCDVSTFISDFVGKAERLIEQLDSPDTAVPQILRLLTSYTVNDLVPLDFEDGSMDFVASTDVLSNILPVPLYFVESKIAERFGGEHSIASLFSDSRIFTAGVGSYVFHITAARRLLADNGILLTSACSAHATLFTSSLRKETGEQILYSYPDESGNPQLATIPRLGLIEGNHITVIDILPPIGRELGLTLLSTDKYSVPLSERQAYRNTPSLGDVETYQAALYELVVMKAGR